MLTFATGLIPLSLYFLAAAVMNFGRRCRVFSGQEDLTLLALGLSGFVMTGPVLFFLPMDAFVFWGVFTWFFLIILYLLMVWFFGTILRFRIVIYNIGTSELRELLTQIAAELDTESRWLGNSLSLPTLGIQFYLEQLPILRNNVLIGTGFRQNYRGWLQFEQTLRKTLRTHQTTQKNFVAILLAILGFLFGTTAAAIFIANQENLFDVIRFIGF